MVLKKFKKGESNTNFKNNTLDNLKRIIELDSKKIDPMLCGNCIVEGDKIVFGSTNINMVDSIPLTSLKYIKKEANQFYKWEADEKEYRNVYEGFYKKRVKTYDEYQDFINHYLTPIYYYLFDNEQTYKFELNKYEITMLTIINTLTENFKLNGKITDEIKFKVIDILIVFINDINGIREKKEQLQLLEKESMNQSLESRLDLELDYQQKFGTNNK
jgi:hypothetical protein